MSNGTVDTMLTHNKHHSLYSNGSVGGDWARDSPALVSVSQQSSCPDLLALKQKMFRVRPKI